MNHFFAPHLDSPNWKAAADSTAASAAHAPLPGLLTPSTSEPVMRKPVRIKPRIHRARY